MGTKEEVWDRRPNRSRGRTPGLESEPPEAIDSGRKQRRKKLKMHNNEILMYCVTAVNRTIEQETHHEMR